MIHLLAVIAIALYVASSALMLIQLWRSKVGGRVSALARGAFLCALAAHTVTMGLVLQDPRFIFLDNGADYFLWVSWALSVAFAFLERRLNYPLVGAFVVPGVVLFMGCSSYLLHKEGASVLVESGGEGRFLGITLSLLHGIPALVSVVTMALAFVVSAVFLVVERRLKERKVGVLSIAGPNLQFLDRLNGRLVQVAFLAISLVVLSGGVWAVSEQKPVFSFDTSVMSGLALWVLLAVILYARMVLGWSPKRVSRLTVLVTATFFATILVVMVVAGRLTHAELWS